jgi:hypothetical protein
LRGASGVAAASLRLRRQWQSASWADAGWLLFSALLFWGSRWAGSRFEGLPGHAAAFWIPALFVARAGVPRPGAAALAALGGASLWSFSRGMGVQDAASFVGAGLALDLLELNSRRLRRLPLALLGGAACALTRFGFHNLPAAVIGVPAHFTSWGFVPVAGLFLAFGLLGGLLGWVILRVGDRLHLRRPPSSG